MFSKSLHEKTLSPSRMRARRAMLALVFALASFHPFARTIDARATLFDETDSRNVSTETREGRLLVFEEVWETVRARYYDASLRGLDWDALGARYRAEAASAGGREEFYYALERLLAHLEDPHTRVFAPGEGDDWRETRFVSVGLALRELAGEIVVENVERDSQAYRAGVRAGDALHSIDGERVSSLLAKRIAQLSPNEESAARRSPNALIMRRAASKLFDGPPASNISAVFRNPDGREIKTRMRRELSKREPELRIRRAGSFAVVEFNLFEPETAARLVRSFKNELKHARGVIIDLRANGGGEAEALTDVASLFIAAGKSLGRFDDRALRPQIEPHTRASLRSTADALARFDGPLVVLTSARTASAAEVLVAALKESGRATATVGENTCGCVLAVRRRHALPDGGALDVSELDYRTARGVRLEGSGVAPDVRVVPTRKSLRAGRDEALKLAIEMLKRRRAR